MLLKTSYKMQPPVSARLISRYPLAHGLVAYWPMIEGGGSRIFDVSGNQNTGTFYNHTTWLPNKFGSCLSFDGTDDYTEASGLIGFTARYPRTISAWVYVKGVTAWASHTMVCVTIPTTTSYLALRILSNADINASKFVADDFDGSESSATSTTVGLANKWFHVVGVFPDRLSRSIYVNGILENTQTTTRYNTATPTAITLGVRVQNSTYDRYSNILLDNVMIYNRVLTVSEIQQLYRDLFYMFERRQSPFDVPAPPPAGAARHTRVAFKPIEGADRLRGLRRNALY